jgi:hypothetical protein
MPFENVFANAEDITIGNFTQSIENKITNATGIDSATYRMIRGPLRVRQHRNERNQQHYHAMLPAH